MNLIHMVNIMDPAGGQSVDSSGTGSQFSEPSINGQVVQQGEERGTIFTLTCGYDDPLGADNVMNPVGSQSEDGLRIGSQFFEVPLMKSHGEEFRGIDEVVQEQERGFSRFDLNLEPVCDKVSDGLFSRTHGFLKHLSGYVHFDLNAADNKEESGVDSSPSISMGLHLDLNECQKDVIRLFGAQFEVNNMDAHCDFAPDQSMVGMPTAATPPGFCQQPQPFFMNMAGSQSAQLELGLNHGFVVNEGNNGGLWSSVNCRHQQPPPTLVLFS